MSIINKLTEGIVRRDLSKEGAALLTKWEKTGLLEGITDDRKRQGMACLLENQAKELLREASTMQGSDVEGFSAVAFPIVRRVFGGLIANDLVSVQPMSLPSGLIFFLDFTYGNPPASKLDYTTGDSVYGGGVVGQQITGGIVLGGPLAEQGFYALNNGYSSPTASVAATFTLQASGVVGDAGTLGDNVDRLCRFDPDLSGTAVAVGTVPLSTLTAGQLNVKDYVTITALAGATVAGNQVRRLTRDADANDQTVGSIADGDLIIVVTGNNIGLATASFNTLDTASFVIDDNFEAGPRSIGSVIGDETWGLENEANIPEIDIKVDSIAVTAKTKKLKAKWTPELAQDLNAYHNLDAEVELTSILSEHIALEIDQEILEDLIKGSTAAKLYWSRLPGKFVNRETGASISGTAFPDFTGNVSEWYETLVETINDVSANIHRKTLRGGANFIVVSPEVANLLEFTLPMTTIVDKLEQLELVP
jgi:hypothetical protein